MSSVSAGASPSPLSLLFRVWHLHLPLSLSLSTLTHLPILSTEISSRERIVGFVEEGLRRGYKVSIARGRMPREDLPTG